MSFHIVVYCHGSQSMDRDPKLGRPNIFLNRSISFANIYKEWNLWPGNYNVPHNENEIILDD